MELVLLRARVTAAASKHENADAELGGKVFEEGTGTGRQKERKAACFFTAPLAQVWSANLQLLTNHNTASIDKPISMTSEDRARATKPPSAAAADLPSGTRRAI